MVEEISENKDLLISEEEVWDVLHFAQQLGYGGMPISIDLMNQRLKDINLLNTGEVTSTQVSDALAAPKSNEEELQRISESFEITSSIYKRLLSYMGNIPQFAYTYVCLNANKEDYAKTGKGQTYLKDLDVLKEFMDSFDYQQEFGKVVREILRQEAAFYVFRDDGDKYVLQELPSDRVKITGRWDYGTLFSFDYAYFMSGGVDINLYPPIFKETLARVQEGTSGKNGYWPSESILGRGTRGFAYWNDCSPLDGFWAFKFTPEMVARIPYFSGMFPDIVQEDVIRELQKNSYMGAASKILIGEVPMLDDSKAAVKDRISITPKLLGQFLALVQSAVNSTVVKVAASPLQNVKGFSWDSDPNIRDSYLRTTLGASGASTNLLFSGDVKPNVLETELSLAVDEILVTSVYPQFNDFVNWHVNRKTKKYKFKVMFEGTKFFTGQKRRFDNAKELASIGIVLPQKIASSQGMSPFDMQRQMEEAAAFGWVDNLTPIIMSSQLGAQDGPGRPKMDETELGDSGAQTRSDGGNLTK